MKMRGENYDKFDGDDDDMTTMLVQWCHRDCENTSWQVTPVRMCLFDMAMLCLAQYPMVCLLQRFLAMSEQALGESKRTCKYTDCFVAVGMVIVSASQPRRLGNQLFVPGMLLEGSPVQ